VAARLKKPRVHAMIADDIGMPITVGATCNAIHHSSDNLLLYASLAMNHFSTYFMFTLALFGIVY
jgi:hypothetical protein